MEAPMGDHADNERPRAREIGIEPGVLSPGLLNAITDVRGVRVGHVTVSEGDDICTGATAVLPHEANPYTEKVPAGIVVGNGYGKLMGSTQVDELGEIETPILLTNTLAVPRAADAILDWVLSQPGSADARSINPVVGETNDGYLNDIRRRALSADAIRLAIERAREGVVVEGSVGAGTGTVAFSWKGGIGSSSRLTPGPGPYTVGALVQSNFGGVLQMVGVPVGQALGRYYLHDGMGREAAEGSIVIVLATDAPLSDRNLRRLARRALAGMARTGASMANGSGDYVIAFSAHEEVRRTPERRSRAWTPLELPNELLSPLFLAAIEATEEAIYNSLFRATTVTGYRGRCVEALPVDRVVAILRAYGRLGAEQV
jgi:D-aminopeptidase